LWPAGDLPLHSESLKTLESILYCHIMAAGSGFAFPAFHSFAPLYTRQPVEATRAKQVQLWCDLIRAYCRARRIFWLDIASANATFLFRNDAINRRLSSEDIQFFLGHLVDRGEGEWDSSRSHCLVFWRRPSEWGELIFDWVQATAQGGQVLTVHEIRGGVQSRDQGMCASDLHCADMCFNVSLTCL
jgi:ESCRT-II complex subunit VPS25